MLRNEDILIADYKKLSISVITQCMTRDQKITNIGTAIGETSLSDRVDIQPTGSHISDIDNHESDGSMVAVRTAVAHDKTGFGTITAFSQLKRRKPMENLTILLMNMWIVLKETRIENNRNNKNCIHLRS